MTDHEHAATGPGPGGPRPAPGTGPTDAARASTEGTGAATGGSAPRAEGTEKRAEGTEKTDNAKKTDSTGAGPGQARSEGQPQGPTRQPGPAEDAPERFRRGRRYKMIAGVCAGLGRQADMDPVIFRITLAVLSATGGIGLIFYGFVWLLVPYEDEEENELTAMPRDITTHWRETSWIPGAAAQVRPAYELGTGRGTLDLTRVRPAKGQTVSTDAHIGAGRLKVIVPADMTVRMNIDVGVGDIKLPGEKNGEDVDVLPQRHREVTLTPAKGGKDSGTLDLTLEVGAGEVEVDRAAP